MFDNLSERISKVIKRLKGHGKLSEKNIADALREVRIALLEADVHYKVTKNFIERIQNRAIGQEVMQSLTPAQQVIKIVHNELTTLISGDTQSLTLKGPSPIVYMIVGLQGSGKTTTSAKIALKLKKYGKKPYLVPADTQRPAAIEQLKQLGKQINVPVHDTQLGNKIENIYLNALNETLHNSADVIILDTAGRLHIDNPLMIELENIRTRLPISQEVLLVIDAMTGQDAINVAKTFHNRLKLSGIIFTKMEGDVRVGAALSIKAVTQIPIKLLGIGENLNDLETFHPNRIANRILGMGDILSLIEKVQEVYDQDKSKKITKKIAKNEFTLEDFRKQLEQIKKIGSIDSIINMLPGFNNFKKKIKNFKINEKDLKHYEAIINSMTLTERYNTNIINASRRKRIAIGSGTTVADVNKLLKNFSETQKIMKIFNKSNNKNNIINFFRKKN